MLGLIIAAIGNARGLTQDETVAVANAVQYILTKKNLDLTTLTVRQAYTILNFAVEAVIEQSRGSATGVAADPTNPPPIT